MWNDDTFVDQSSVDRVSCRGRLVLVLVLQAIPDRGKNSKIPIPAPADIATPSGRACENENSLQIRKCVIHAV